MKIRWIAHSSLTASIILASHGSVLANENNRSPGMPHGAASAPQTGIGANVEIVIPLGSGPRSPQKDRWNLQLSAGPQLSWSATNDSKRQRRLSPLLHFSLRPQHSNKLSIAGYNMFTTWDRSVSAAERANDEQRSASSGISTAGWVGILLGSAAVVGGIFALSDSEPCDVCDPEDGICLPTPC